MLHFPKARKILPEIELRVRTSNYSQEKSPQNPEIQIPRISQESLLSAAAQEPSLASRRK